MARKRDVSQAGVRARQAQQRIKARIRTRRGHVAKIVAMHSAGLTHEQIGSHFGRTAVWAEVTRITSGKPNGDSLDADTRRVRRTAGPSKPLAVDLNLIGDANDTVDIATDVLVVGTVMD